MGPSEEDTAVGNDPSGGQTRGGAEAHRADSRSDLETEWIASAKFRQCEEIEGRAGKDDARTLGKAKGAWGRAGKTSAPEGTTDKENKVAAEVARVRVDLRAGSKQGDCHAEQADCQKVIHYHLSTPPLPPLPHSIIIWVTARVRLRWRSTKSTWQMCSSSTKPISCSSPSCPAVDTRPSSVEDSTLSIPHPITSPPTSKSSLSDTQTQLLWAVHRVRQPHAARLLLHPRDQRHLYGRKITWGIHPITQIFHEIYSINIKDEILARKRHYEKFSESEARLPLSRFGTCSTPSSTPAASSSPTRSNPATSRPAASSSTTADTSSSAASSLSQNLDQPHSPTTSVIHTQCSTRRTNRNAGEQRA